MNEELNENTVGNWFQDNTNLEVYNKRYWNKDENFQLLKSASDKMNNFLGNEKLENVFDLENGHMLGNMIFFTLTTAHILKVSDIIIIQL